MGKEDNVLTKLHDLLLYLIPQLNKFPRNQKFVLGDRIQGRMMEVQEDCLRAYYGHEKRGYLQAANMNIEVTRHLIRLAYGLHLFNGKTYEVLSQKLDEIGRMIGGWVKSLTHKTASSKDMQAHGHSQ